MKKFIVTVPVVVSLSYEVEAGSEDLAMDVEAPAIYTDAGGGISVGQGGVLGYAGADAFQWEHLDVEEKAP